MHIIELIAEQIFEPVLADEGIAFEVKKYGRSRAPVDVSARSRRGPAVVACAVNAEGEADDPASICFAASTKTRGSIMAKRKKQAKVKRRGKLPRGDSAKRGKARKVSKAATKRTVAKAKPKRAPVKKAAQKEVALAVETVEHPAPEFEEVSRVSPGPDEPEQ